MKCDYCGEEKEVRTIINPNMNDEKNPFWKVCEGCEEAIEDAKKKDIEMMLGSFKMRGGK